MNTRRYLCVKYTSELNLNVILSMMLSGRKLHQRTFCTSALYPSLILTVNLPPWDGEMVQLTRTGHVMVSLPTSAKKQGIYRYLLYLITLSNVFYLTD